MNLVLHPGQKALAGVGKDGLERTMWAGHGARVLEVSAGFELGASYLVFLSLSFPYCEREFFLGRGVVLRQGLTL